MQVAHHGAVTVPQVRGVRPNPQKLHAKVLDHDNGCYTVTYKPEVSGQLEISISCDGIAISDAHFTAPSQPKLKARGTSSLPACTCSPRRPRLPTGDAQGGTLPMRVARRRAQACDRAPTHVLRH